MLIKTSDDFQHLIVRIEECERVVVDVETSGLDHHKNHIVGYVITVGPAPDDTFYWPVRHKTGNYQHNGQYPQSNTGWNRTSFSEEQALIQLLSRKPIIAHNAQFDMGFLADVYWRPARCEQPIHDTMVLAFVANDIAKGFSLDASCEEWGVAAKKGDVMYERLGQHLGVEPAKKLMSEFWQLPGDDPVVVDYACGDGTSTWQLHEVLWKAVRTPYYENANGCYDLVDIANLEVDVTAALFRKHRAGIAIDEQRLHEVIKHFETEYERSAALVGDVNARSGPSVLAYMQKHGVTGGWPLTAKGAPSFKEEFLLTNEPGRALVAVRKNRTLLDNFLLKIRDQFLHNGRIYPQFNQTKGEDFGVVSGRMSTTAPNVGAMPGKRQGDVGKMYREIFVPDEGMAFTEADFKSCEVVIAAHYSDAKVWRRGAFNAAAFHQEVADELSITKALGKQLNLGVIMGLGKASFSNRAGLSLAEGSAFYDKFFERVPELKTLQKGAAASFRQRGFVRTLLGRRLQLKEERHDYHATNRLTQGGNADICKAMIVAIDKLDDVTLPMTVYDSALFQHAKGDTIARNRALEVMCNMKGLGVDLSCPMGIEYNEVEADSWSSATFGEPQSSFYYYKGERYEPGSLNSEEELCK